jgi:aspartate/methionine/tyrosine aminotransferase
MHKHDTAISLGLGELKDFKVDRNITNAMIDSLDGNGVDYSQNAGIPELRDAIAHNQSKIDGYSYNIDNVTITIGVQNAIYVTIKTLSKLGAKRVLIPEINFGIYKKIPTEFNLTTETYQLTDNFDIDIDKLSNIIKDDDIIIINSPSNPTGKVLSLSNLKSLGALLKKKLTKGYVISDEIYNSLIYDDINTTSISKFYDRTIIVNGISKSAASAGLRVGWAITNNTKLSTAITSNNAMIISCPPTANQYAAIPVVNGETNNTIKKYNSILKKNRDFAIKELKNNNLPFVTPFGSFYIFPKIGHLINVPVKDFCINTAKKENGVVVIPGEVFGAKDNIRISLASSQLEEGILRFTKSIKEYLI